jgi:small-conductance mechanosensitive channel
MFGLTAKFRLTVHDARHVELSRVPVLVIVLIAVSAAALVPTAAAQQPADSADVDDQPAALEGEAPPAPQQVDVEPVATDEAIAERLTRILNATEWFQDPQVRVDEGVVFLSGKTANERYRTWAGDLARNTKGVVAAVNRIEIVEGSLWDLSPAWAEIRRLMRSGVQAVPLMGLALVLLLATWLASKLMVRLANTVLQPQIANELLRRVITRATAIPVFLLGIYLILRISGLTQMAVTVIGGTGLAGLVVGIAFRDIAENFLASILISIQRPFATGDLIEVVGVQGFVQHVSTRGTLLMTLEGNHVQIPNSTIYKAVVRNFTANPQMRLDFVVGIGYADDIAAAQEIAMNVLRHHPVVLDDPEPLVLVEALGAATVTLHLYFWIDARQHSFLKTRSSVIRLVKRAFEQSGVSMPDEAREVVFPQGVPLVAPDGNGVAAPRSPVAVPREFATTRPGDDTVTTTSEGGLSSEAQEIEQQARKSRRLAEGANLLEN